MKTHNLTKEKTLGIAFNTDGVSPFKSSLITIWPIYISLVNLPPCVRMLKRNIITCLFWVGNCKPQMPLFLAHFQKMLSDLKATGLKAKTSDGLND